MTKQEKLIVSAYTGVLLCDYPDFHEYAEQILERKIPIQDFSVPDVWDELRLKVSAQFMDLQNSPETPVKIVGTNLYDKEEIFHNCAVQVLTNSVTGQQSIGWWLEDDPPTSV